MRPEDFDVNRSWWAATAPPADPTPPLSGDTVADVVIVGGGFTGISTARELVRRRPGLGVVVLEATTCGNGASGRNGGQLLNWINGASPDDPEKIKRIWDTTLHGIEQVVARAKAGPVRWRRDGALETYTSQDRAEKAHAKVEKLNAIGIPVRFLSGDALRKACRAEGVVGAVLDPTAGVLSGLDLIRATLPELRAAGVRIHENTPVTRIEEGETVTVTTPNGVVRAKSLVLAAGGYTGLLGYFKSETFPLISYAVSVPMQAGDWGDADCFSDDLDRISYAARAPGDALVFGGGSNTSYNYLYGGRTAHDPEPKHLAALRRRLGAYFPAQGELPFTHSWSGTLSITMSRLCSIGRRGNIYWGLGYSGHGVTLANLAGEVLADLYVGDGEKWSDLPFFNAPLGWIPPDPFRWTGYHIYTALTGRSPRRG